MSTKLKNLEYVEMSITLAHKSLSELEYLAVSRDPDQIRLVNSATFSFYRVCLHYVFVMEFNKLMEPDKSTRYPANHFASLEKASATILKLHPDDFISHHEKNLKTLSNIRTADFHQKMKDDRDRKFAHSDGTYPDPFRIQGMDEEAIAEGFKVLRLMGEVFKRCTGFFDYEFIYDHRDTRTDNFIIHHAQYKKYYMDHYMDAMSKELKNGMWPRKRLSGK